MRVKECSRSLSVSATNCVQDGGVLLSDAGCVKETPILDLGHTRPHFIKDAPVHARGALTADRTCEIGMSRATGKPYRHVLEVLGELSR